MVIKWQWYMVTVCGWDVRGQERRCVSGTGLVLVHTAAQPWAKRVEADRVHSFRTVRTPLA